MEYTWDEDVRRAAAAEDTQRRNHVWHDLDTLLAFGVPAAALLVRWRMLGITAADLRWTRREFAKRYHPDLTKTDEACALANLRLGRANAVLDQALAIIKARKTKGTT